MLHDGNIVTSEKSFRIQNYKKMYGAQNMKFKYLVGPMNLSVNHYL